MITSGLLRRAWPDIARWMQTTCNGITFRNLLMKAIKLFVNKQLRVNIPALRYPRLGGDANEALSSWV